MEEGRDRGDLDGTSTVPRAMTAYARSRCGAGRAMTVANVMRRVRGRSPACGVSWAVDGFVASLAGASEHTRCGVRARRAASSSRGASAAVARSAVRARPRARCAATSRTCRRADSLGRRSPARPRRVRAYLRYLRRRGVLATRSGPVAADAEGRGAAAARAAAGAKPARCSTLPPPPRSRTDDAAAGGDGVAGPRRARAALRRRAPGQRVLRARLGDVDLRRGHRHRARQGREGAPACRSASPPGRGPRTTSGRAGPSS